MLVVEGGRFQLWKYVRDKKEIRDVFFLLFIFLDFFGFFLHVLKQHVHNHFLIINFLFVYNYKFWDSRYRKKQWEGHLRIGQPQGSWSKCKWFFWLYNFNFNVYKKVFKINTQMIFVFLLNYCGPTSNPPSVRIDTSVVYLLR